MCAPPFETYFFQFHALFTWKQDVRPPICDKTAPPIWKILDPPLENERIWTPGGARVPGAPPWIHQCLWTHLYGVIRQIL